MPRTHNNMESVCTWVRDHLTCLILGTYHRTLFAAVAIRQPRDSFYSVAYLLMKLAYGHAQHALMHIVKCLALWRHTSVEATTLLLTLLLLSLKFALVRGLHQAHSSGGESSRCSRSIHHAIDKSASGTARTGALKDGEPTSSYDIADCSLSSGSHRAWKMVSGLNVHDV